MRTVIIEGVEITPDGPRAVKIQLLMSSTMLTAAIIGEEGSIEAPNPAAGDFYQPA
jgi:hypothetical protein